MILYLKEEECAVVLFFYRFCASLPFISVILLFQFSLGFLFSLAFALFLFFEDPFFLRFCRSPVSAPSYLSHYGRKFHAMFFLAGMIAVIKQDPADGTFNGWGQYEGKFHVLFRKASPPIRDAIVHGLFFFFFFVSSTKFIFPPIRESSGPWHGLWYTQKCLPSVCLLGLILDTWSLRQLYSWKGKVVYSAVTEYLEWVSD